MHQFVYQRPGSLPEAVEQSMQAREGLFLAGGMTLIPTMKLRLTAPSNLIDLTDLVELKGIRQEDNAIIVGATTIHAQVASTPEVRDLLPALAALAESIGDPQVRNRGTIGGSIANADPAADYPAAVVGLGAIVKTNMRTIAGDDFFTGLFETALDPNELIVAVSFPIPQRAAYMKFPNPASRYAIVGVMVSQGDDGVRVAVTGAGPNVFRVPEMEQALADNFAPEVLEEIMVSSNELNEDLHASADYRAHLIKVMVKRAVVAAS
jgi:carbon-monoxide dehydrogenase medium subunit